MILRVFLASWCIFVSAASGLIAADLAPLDPNQPYRAQRDKPVKYRVKFQVVVTPPAKTRLLKIWLPLPQNDFGQQISDDSLTSSPLEIQPQVAAEPIFGNKFAHFVFHDPQGAQIICHQFTITVWELHWNLDSRKVIQVSQWPAAFDRYRGGERQAVVVNERFRRLAEQVVPQRGNPFQDMQTVMSWVNDHFHYNLTNASLTASAEHGLETHCGNCGDYHALCASLGRMMGYPTRITYGIQPFPKNSPSHCKLEVYLPPYGWVSFDVSETQKMIAAIQGDNRLGNNAKSRLVDAARRRLFAGFRDATYIVETRGTEFDLAPPIGRKLPVVRTAYIEADGVPLPEPDPGNPERREFAWMTVHQYLADQPVGYPFKDLRSLDSWVRPAGDPK